MKTAIFFLLTSFPIFHCFCQSKITFIKFCPLALIDDNSFPTIQGGIEFNLSDKISWYNELGIKYRKSFYENINVDTNFIASKGFKVKSEIRYYFQANKIKNKEQHYFAINGFFYQDHHNTQISYYLNSDSSSYKKDAFGVQKNVFGLNFIYGYQEQLAKKIFVDFYAGVGIRLRNISTKQKEYDDTRDSYVSPSVDINLRAERDQVDAKAGNSFLKHVTFGLRLCYKL